MADIYPIQAPVVLSEGNYATPTSVQRAFNVLTAAIRLALNSIATGGSFSNVNINGGTIDGVTIGGMVPGSGTFSALTGGGGTTVQRPAVPLLFQTYFDTTIGQPVWCTQISPPIWVNSAGVAT